MDLPDVLAAREARTLLQRLNGALIAAKAHALRCEDTAKQALGDTPLTEDIQDLRMALAELEVDVNARLYTPPSQWWDVKLIDPRNPERGPQIYRIEADTEWQAMDAAEAVTGQRATDCIPKDGPF
jgi:hypothetical protein